MSSIVSENRSTYNGSTLSTPNFTIMHAEVIEFLSPHKTDLKDKTIVNGFF